ncbi:MAG: DUF262 domain-containing protein [Cyanobacteria bacterium J06573_11]
MSISINAKDQPLSKVFSDDFAFSIPHYQRPYAWTTEQASELLADVCLSLENQPEAPSELPPYFLGSIVLIKQESKPEADVVDGQQRLTTITILISVLRSLEQPENAAIMTPFICQKGNEFLGLKDRYRLRLKEREASFFEKYIQKGSNLEELFALEPQHLTSSQRHIRENARYFFDKLKLLSDGERSRLISYLLVRCFLVVVSTPDLDSAYRIFSTLNARGLNLSLTDLLKARIIGAIPEDEQAKYTRIWEIEEEDLGREAFQELFSHIRMIYRKTKLKETALNEFLKYIQPDKEPKRFIDETLKPYSDAIDIVKKADYKGPNAALINPIFGWLNQIDNFDWVPAAILYISKHKNFPGKLEEFFADLERLAAGLMIMRAYSHTRIGRYAKLIASIEEDADLFLDDSPLQLTSDEKEKILETLNGDLYLIVRIRQYVLLRLDCVLADGAASYDYKTITVEHILPQNPKADSQWVDWFKYKDQSEYVHKIGNLTLLSRKKNSQAQNYEFAKKKEKYFSSSAGVSSFVMTTQVLQQAKWTPDVIEARQAELVGKLKDLWRL